MAHAILLWLSGGTVACGTIRCAGTVGQPSGVEANGNRRTGKAEAGR